MRTVLAVAILALWGVLCVKEVYRLHPTPDVVTINPAPPEAPCTPVWQKTTYRFGDRKVWKSDSCPGPVQYQARR